MSKIGFMQGRLSSVVDGKIQAFPWENWEAEFKYARDLDLNLIEWTIDFDRLYENPLMIESGRCQILNLCQKYGIEIQSLTGDCFMQIPFYKANGSLHKKLFEDFERVVEASIMQGIKFIVVPLVDNGAIENDIQENLLFEGIISLLPKLKAHNTFIAFESDFHPQALAKFIDRYPSNIGINYDIGNSASMGFDSSIEFLEYGNRILNVHVKDRILGGSTVPLGYGNANLPKVFSGLRKIGYSGNYILQTARAKDGNHGPVLAQYKKMIEGWLS